MEFRADGITVSILAAPNHAPTPHAPSTDKVQQMAPIDYCWQIAREHPRTDLAAESTFDVCLAGSMNGGIDDLTAKVKIQQAALCKIPLLWDMFEVRCPLSRPVVVVCGVHQEALLSGKGLGVLGAVH